MSPFTFERYVCYPPQHDRILVTGGAGFIGSAFIRFLLSKPDFRGSIVNLDLLTYAADLGHLNAIQEDPRYFFVHGDIRNRELLDHICLEHRIDVIVHFAAESHVDRSIVGPQEFIETNILGTFQLLELARKYPHIHFHHVSTDEVYGSLGSTGYFTESTPYHPNSPYSASKAASDHLVRSYHHTYGIRTTLSNCSNNYGPCQHHEKLIPLMIQKCITRQPLPIYGTGNNIRDWLYVDDHVEAIWTIIKKGESGESYNIGGEAEWRNIDLVHRIVDVVAQMLEIDVLELERLITFVQDRPGHDQRYAIDCSKIKTELGWQPRHSFDQGLFRTISWYLQQSNLQKLGR